MGKTKPIERKVAFMVGAFPLDIDRTSNTGGGILTSDHLVESIML